MLIIRWYEIFLPVNVRVVLEILNSSYQPIAAIQMQNAFYKGRGFHFNSTLTLISFLGVVTT
jgi:hypothetical protein